MKSLQSNLLHFYLIRRKSLQLAHIFATLFVTRAKICNILWPLQITCNLNLKMYVLFIQICEFLASKYQYCGIVVMTSAQHHLQNFTFVSLDPHFWEKVICFQQVKDYRIPKTNVSHVLWLDEWFAWLCWRQIQLKLRNVALHLKKTTQLYKCLTVLIISLQC